MSEEQAERLIKAVKGVETTLFMLFCAGVVGFALVAHHLGWAGK